MTRAQHYNASSGLPVKLLESSDSFILKLGDLKVDTVLSATHFINKSQNLRRYGLTDPLIQLWEAALPFQPQDNTLRDWIASGVMATTAEHHLLGGRTAEQILKDGAASLYNNLSINEYQPSCRAHNQRVLGSLPELSTGGDAEIYAALASNFCLNQKFFVTHEGRMGTGPTGTELGNLICELFGGGVPYILRRQDSTFLLVGESYPNGIMDGEAVRAWQRGELAEETIELIKICNRVVLMVI